MFILFSETDLDSQTAARDVGRKFAAAIDKAVYGLLGIVFQLFFSVASADIFSSGMISKFYARIQLIIGVFVLFQLAMTILRGIVNPEGFTDSKSGAGNIVMRICTALVMLALIVPINIPSASNEFEKQINNNGLLFGTLYSLQHRILTNNTIGKVVMGVGDNDGDSNYMVGTDNESFKKAADTFTSTILKGFYRINLVPESERKHEEGKEDDQINDNRVCTDIEPDVINEYKKIDANPGTIIDFINITCEPDFSWKNHFVLTKYTEGTKKYAFTFMPVVSSIIGIVFVLILLGFCVDVAVRAIKLAILRLLAPIPIITYMDPKGGKDGAFSAWTKALISTYLDLFIRVASVYFVIYMIQEMLVHGITTNSTGTLKVFTVIFIWIGLFYFAKEAPKFIKQVLGIKDDGGGGIFSGLGKVVGLGAAAVGAVGAFRSSQAASRDADIQKLMDKNPGMTREQAEAQVRGNKANKAKHIVAGIAGGALGVATGATAAIGAKDHRTGAALAAMKARNSRVRELGSKGGTFFGAVGSEMQQYFTGQNEGDVLENKWKAEEAALKYAKQKNAERKTIMDRASSKGIESLVTRGKINVEKGNPLEKYNGLTANYATLSSQIADARTRGDKTIEIAGFGDINMADAEIILREIKDLNIADYAEQSLVGTIKDETIKSAAARFQAANNGTAVESTFGDMKGAYGSTNSDITRRELEMATEKQSGKATRATANASRFKGGNK